MSTRKVVQVVAATVSGICSIAAAIVDQHQNDPAAHPGQYCAHSRYAVHYGQVCNDWENDPTSTPGSLFDCTDTTLGGDYGYGDYGLGTDDDYGLGLDDDDC